jgi:RNA polymerase sigma factor (sigma-70 family)
VATRETGNLVRRAQSGDRDAYGELVDRFRDAVFALCYHRCGEFEPARDLAQDAFVQAWMHLGQLTDPDRFPGWLRRIAERVCIGWRRRRRDEAPLQEVADEGAGPLDDAAAVRMTVQRALAALPEHQRLVATLHYIDGYTYAELGEFLSAPEPTVRSRLRAARVRLRGALAEMVEEGLRAERPADRFREEVMMRVTDVCVKEDTDQLRGGPVPVLLLSDEERSVPIWIGESEAHAVLYGLAEQRPPRPLTYDLMLNSWALFGIQLAGVRISDLRENAYHGEIQLTLGEETKVLDSRASDAVNLALRADVPVEVDDRVLEKMDVTPAAARRYQDMPDFPTGPGDLPPLHQTAFEGDMDQAKRLLSEGHDVGGRNPFGVTPLRIAAQRGHTDLIDLLVAAGATVHVKDREGRTPLHCAAANDHEDACQRLLSAGAKVNARDEEGLTPLHVSDGAGVARLLLSHGSYLNARDGDGRTPLHVAASNGRTGVAEALLEAGARLNARDSSGATALGLATTPEMKDLLVERGATS